MYKISFIAILLCLMSTSLHSQNLAPEIFPVILEPIEHSLIVSQMNTRVVEIPYKMGDAFVKGDLLVLFDNSSFKANVNKAEKSLKKTTEDFKVKQALLKDHLVSDLEVLEAEAAVAAAEYDYATAKQIFEESEIRAPYDGKVASINIHIFEIPVREKPIMEIFNDYVLVANILVPSHYLNEVKIMDPVYIRVNDTGKIITAVIKRISPLINPASSTVKIEAEIDNHNSSLKSGMQSQAAFKKEAFEEKGTSFDQIMNEIRSDDQSTTKDGKKL